MNNKIWLLLPLLAVCLYSCWPRYHTWFTVKNNSNKTIYFTYPGNYPDTTADTSTNIPPGITKMPSTPLDPGKSYTKSAPGTFEDYFKTIPSDTLQLFIYDADVVKHTPWATVVSQNLILKRYTLTLDSIRKLNGVISYP
jgi:hypothetical protein